VVGDLAGFAAAVALRGVPFVQVPTTLLRRWTARSAARRHHLPVGKNLVGAFHQPDRAGRQRRARHPAPRERRAGYAEVAKHGLLHGRALVLVRGGGRAGGGRRRRGAAPRRARILPAESAVVARTSGRRARRAGRALLNLGHTFGHAFEAECGYGGALLHGGGGGGRARAGGGALGAAWPLRPGPAGAVVAHLRACGLPAEVADLSAMLGRRFSAGRLLARMAKDKKVRDGAMRFVLLRGPAMPSPPRRFRRRGGGAAARGRLRCVDRPPPVRAIAPAKPHIEHARHAPLAARQPPAPAPSRDRHAGYQRDDGLFDIEAHLVGHQEPIPRETATRGTVIEARRCTACGCG
jgi:3-dehydroquinate synthetase